MDTNTNTKKNTKIVRVKVKKKKLKIKKILCIIFFATVFFLVFQFIDTIKIKNIIIIGNQLISDQEIIEYLNLQDYPSFYLLNNSSLEKSLLENKLINSIDVSRKLLKKQIYIEIEEYKVFFNYQDKIYLESKLYIEGSSIITARFINEIDDEYLEKFLIAYDLIDYDIVKLVSEIEYIPNEVDDERFRLTMVDGNDIYLTLSKILELNNYFELKSKVGDSIGIFHLDSGIYFEAGE